MKKNIFYVCLLFILFFSACNQYSSSEETIKKIPNENNLTDESTLKALQDAIMNNPDNAAPNFQMGLYYIRKKQDSLAIPFLEKALQIDSTQENYFINLSKAYNNLGKANKALNILERSRSINDKNLELLILKGEIYYHIKEYNESVKILNQALNISRKDARIYYWKANNEIARLDSANAFKNLVLALKYNPNYYQAYHSYAELFSKYELYNASIYYANLGLKINPNDEKLNFSKAESFRLKRFAEDSAYFYYKKTYQINPKIWQASYFVGKYIFEKGQIQEAKKYFLHSLKYKNFSFSRYYLGLCYFYGQEKSKALKELLKATELDPQNLAANEWYWKIKGEIEMEKMYKYEDSLRKEYYKRMKEQMIPLPQTPTTNN